MGACPTRRFGSTLTVTQFRGGIHDLRRGGLRLVDESNFPIFEAKVGSVMYNILSLYP